MNTTRYGVCVVNNRGDVNWLGKDDDSNWTLYSEPAEAYQFTAVMNALAKKDLASNLAIFTYGMIVLKTSVQILSF